MEDGRYAVAVEPVAIPMETLEARSFELQYSPLTGKNYRRTYIYGQEQAEIQRQMPWYKIFST